MTRGPWAGGVFAGVLLIAIAYATAWLPGGAPHWAAFVMIVGCAFVLSCMVALGALRAGVRVGRIVAAAIFLFVVIVLGFGAPFFLPEESADGLLIFGLPLRAAIEIFGVGLLPLFVLPFVFAKEFRAADLNDAAVALLKAECARLRAERAGAGGGT